MEEREDWHLTEDVLHEFGRGDPFAAAIRGTRMPMIITDARQADNPIVFANEAFQDLTGYSREELIGRNCRLLQGRETSSDAIAKIRAGIAAAEPLNVDILNYRKDGSTFWNALYVSPVRSKEGKVQFFFASQLDVTERVNAQRAALEQNAIIEAQVRSRTAALQKALEAKTTLLHEVDHRVKNNLMMIGALLRLQSRTLSDPKLSATLDNMLSRVDALASVHRKLYQSDDLAQFDFAEFASTLVDDVLGASGRDDISVEKALGPTIIPASQASALGLILNEVVTNAVKHGFGRDRGGKLAVRVGQTDGKTLLTVADDGDGFNFEAAPNGSMGRALVSRLSRQLGATTTWASASPGTLVTVSLPQGDDSNVP